MQQLFSILLILILLSLNLKSQNLKSQNQTNDNYFNKNNSLNLTLSLKIIDYDTKLELNDLNLNIQNNCNFRTKIEVNQETIILNNLNICEDNIRFDLDFEKKGYKTQHLILNKSKIELLTSPVIKLNIYLIPLSYKTTPIIVYADNLNTNNHIGHEHVIDGRKLLKEQSQTLANTLKNEVGFAVNSMGPATARPVIRGLNGNRIQINEDGMPSIDLSATSPDHSVTTDANGAERIEIIRGPKVLVYTPVAISGVIDVIKNKIPFNFPHKSNFNTYSIFESMNMGRVLGANFELPFGLKEVEQTSNNQNNSTNDQNKFEYLFKSNLSYKNTNDIQSPKKILKNSASESYNISTSLISKSDYFDLAGAFTTHKNEYEIPGGFVGAHPNGVTIDLEKTNFSLNSEIHLHNEFLDDIKLNFARSYYFHTEYESNGSIGAQFRIENYFFSSDFIQHKGEIFSDGIFGISANYKLFDIGGFVFTPPTKHLNLSSYLYEEANFDNYILQISGRFYIDNFSPEASVNVKQENAVAKSFVNYSASLSLINQYEENIYTGITISRTSKAPTIEELYSEGPHLAAYSYEVGNINLNSETGYGFEIFQNLKYESFNFSVNLYYNYFDYYITPRNTGRINVAQLIPIFATSGVESRIYGLETKFEYFLFDDIILRGNLSYTNGQNLEENIPLPMIPPLKSKIDLTYNYGENVINLFTNIGASQYRLDTFEQFTAAYNTFGIEYSTLFSFDESVISAAITVDNIFNQEYFNHLSRIKSIMPEPGRNFRINLKYLM